MESNLLSFGLVPCFPDTIRGLFTWRCCDVLVHAFVEARDHNHLVQFGYHLGFAGARASRASTGTRRDLNFLHEVIQDPFGGLYRELAEGSAKPDVDMGKGQSIGFEIPDHP